MRLPGRLADCGSVAGAEADGRGGAHHHDLGGDSGFAERRAIWRAAKSLLAGWFPCMVAEWNFVRRCANLIAMKDRILVLGFGPAGDFNSFDGLPLPVCKNARAPRDRRFKGEAAWSFCAAKNEYYYGFKAGALANSNDEIFRVWLGPANNLLIRYERLAAAA